MSLQESPGAVAASTAPAAIIVQQGKVLDFIDGTTQRPETPEEYVRQEIAKSLVREYGYAKATIAVEFKIKLGSSSKRADLVVFPEGTAHTQENAWLIVECKHQDVKPADRKECWRSRKTDHRCSLKIDQGRKLAASAASVG